MVSQVFPNLNVTQSRTASGIFGDPVWDAALKFIERYHQQNEKMLAPDEFCNLFANSYPYFHSYSESSNFFQWVLIHKGRISELNTRFVINLCRTNAPVFANEVFVIFTPLKEVPKSQFHKNHFRSLLILLGQLQTNRLIDRLISFKTKAKQEQLALGDRKSIPLIERKFEPKGWFSCQKIPLCVPLSWAATSEQQPFANLGDALSPIIISALSGLPVQHRNFKSYQRRLAAVGTIAHGLENGAVHLWGTGTDAEKTADRSRSQDSPKSLTQFHVHAVRGLRTARILQQQGIDVPPVYGDPVWFLPSIIPPAATKQYELGIVVHLSELTDLTTQAFVNPNLLRYHIPDLIASCIRIITTITQPTFADLEKRTQEITACKRIVSTSLHGLVIAEAYGIPCTYLWDKGTGIVFASIENESQWIDWRIHDFLSGVGVKQRFIYGQRCSKPTDWEAVMRAIDRYWNPIDWSPETFLAAFPLPLAFNPLQGQLFQNRSLLQQIKL